MDEEYNKLKEEHEKLKGEVEKKEGGEKEKGAAGGEKGEWCLALKEKKITLFKNKNVLLFPPK